MHQHSKNPHPHHHGHPGGKNSEDTNTNTLRLVAWETTRRCNLSCVHCRAAAEDHFYENELDTKAAFKLMDEIRTVGQPIIILTGGEPLLRSDIFDIASYGTKIGLRMVMAPNGTMITKENARKMKESGIKRLSISLDGATKEKHDKFRGVEGAYEGALNGIKIAKEAGLEFQINTTITKANLDEIPAILALAEKLEAVAHHIFLLVPTGRGKYIVDQEIDATAYETTLNWFYDQRDKTTLQLKATCAPHYYRILRQRAKKEGKSVTFESHGLDAVTRGCLAGTGFCFISHIGEVQTCGFLDVKCGDVTKNHFKEIWDNSEVFTKLRNMDNLDGKCGICEYRKVCGGCRARAYEATGNYMAEEPLCTYIPSREKR
ncbi:putative coenzyme PQQ biosynthesis protein E, ppqE, radical SAM superfamily protein [Desulfamplus magnetovallimortis]|uniref:Putative coenzyme PQQ biosynthesis protein E, ppqE, radical SAM superfamily protein n=1 Tax=Desulfamplus magnetovallimortis TaxID=1246637 RepID=A0A1W1H4X5_9BACT|nr:heme b synthase [Desulfamplus magnetovallimortis]SLM27418.1 putative coenzyme PQQ biosynthesis protein E, ppqE, radical SAM superfamily protein [Desulfamplus magnetovallimortis]